MECVTLFRPESHNNGANDMQSSTKIMQFLDKCQASKSRQNYMKSKLRASRTYKILKL